MNDNFKTYLDTLVAEGFPQLTEQVGGEVRALDFKITPYSLNTKLSFKFDNLDHFIEFLKLHDNRDVEKKTAVLQATLFDLGLDVKEFFWVNFFERVDEEV